MLAAEAFGGTSTGDSAVSIGGVMRVNGGGGFLCVVRSTGSNVPTANVVPISASAASGGLNSELFIAVATAAIAIAYAMVEKSVTVSSFSVRAFFMGMSLIFCVEDRF